MAEIDHISRILGALEAEVKDFGRRFDRLEVRMDDRDQTLADLQFSVSDTAEDVRYLKGVITADVKPVTDQVKQWRAMGMGALAIIGVGGAAIGSAGLWAIQHLLPGIRWP